MSQDSSNPGIRAVHIDAARKLVELHTRGRLPSALSRTPGPSQAPGPVPPARMPAKVTVPAPSHSKETCTNPQCNHCGAVIIPSPSSSLPINETPSIAINDWEVYTARKPILNAQELEVLENKYDIPLPEMIFGHNKVELYNPKLGWGFKMNTNDAMDLIKTHIENPDEIIKVSYANEWYKSRQNQHSNTEGKIIDVYKPYDWTYTTDYKGDEFATNKKHFVRDDTLTIPLNKLTERVPILFFQEFVLYEDELGDNGISMLTVKIRCMKHCMLILLRFFLRVDSVLFRVYDTRVYVDFEENKVIREFKKQESSYEYVSKKISPATGDPRSLMRDSNWCSSVMQVVSIERDHIEL